MCLSQHSSVFGIDLSDDPAKEAVGTCVDADTLQVDPISQECTLTCGKQVAFERTREVSTKT
jgi:hypothetical protein